MPKSLQATPIDPRLAALRRSSGVKIKVPNALKTSWLLDTK